MVEVGVHGLSVIIRTKPIVNKSKNNIYICIEYIEIVNHLFSFSH